MAKRVLPPLYWTRYINKGTQLQFDHDKVITSDTTWLRESVSRTYYAKNNTLRVVSPYLRNDYFVNCKVVTFSRVLEWVLVDAFKKRH